jgi:tRNA (adenine22-N1)-methyltransferase
LNGRAGRWSLSPRLAAIAALVPPGATVADIGTDHAALPLDLVRSGRADRVIATETAAAPYAAALRALLAAGAELSARVDLRFGRGLAPLRPGEVSVIVLAGMGGRLMLEILAQGEMVVRGAAHAGASAAESAGDSAPLLILQPQSHLEQVRLTLTHRGFSLLHEELAAEGPRLYVVMTLRWTGAGSPWEPAGDAGDLRWEVGPLLLARPDPLVGEYLALLAAREEEKLRRLEPADGPRAGRARGAAKRRIESIRLLRDEVRMREGTGA